jgi:site-specific recombinase XerD
MKKKVVLERLSHLGASHLAIRFEIDREIISLVKRLPGIRFSATHRCWYLPLSRENHESILRVLGALAVIDDSALGIDREPPPRIVSEALERMTEKLILKGYSDNTQRTYLNQFKCFLLHYSGRAPVELAEQHITDYLLMIVREKKYSRSTHNQAINAIKFYYEQVLYESPKVYRVERPQKERRLPVILNEQEIAALFNAVENIKHKVMLMILYASGLRRSEVLNLLPGDVDFERGMIFIRGGKGRKDRQSVLSKSLKPLLDAYIKKYRPITWMFEGPDHKPYSATSLQVILRRAVKKAGIQKHVKLHSLRHSFATHLLEAGTSTRYIQVLLGHESSRTTEIYTHVANFGVDRVKSPLDHLNLDGLDGK